MASAPAGYRAWVRQVARGLRDGAVQGISRALVVLEPDALALDCVGEGRFALLRYATKRLAAPDGAWCNPPGRGLGEVPRMVRGVRLDALLWVKRPGESDGTCRGGPPAGRWGQDYDLELVGNRKR